MQIVITVDNFDELRAAARQILDMVQDTAPYIPAAPAAASLPKPEPQMTSASATTGAVAKPQQETNTAAKPQQKNVSRQDVQAKAIALMDAGKQEMLQALLQKYQVPALPSIPEEQLGAFLADLEAM